MSQSNKFSPEVSYQPLIDFKPIGLVSQSPGVIACLPSLGAATLREALAAARRRPGGITVGTRDHGSPLRVAVKLLRAQSAPGHRACALQERWPRDRRVAG
ncbi:hypothetical protein [Variovorax sp. 22077]|uniref:hypothetical protein n=1 Tax=Variovorax sp. 22077 TaxID=3453867 RepID=UPI003F843FC1